MADPLSKPLTKKQSKFFRGYYGRISRDIGIGMVAGIFTALFLNGVKGINIWLVVTLGFLLVVIGEMMTFWEEFKGKS